MHDIRMIRAEPEAFDAAMARRKVAPVAQAILAHDSERRAAQAALQDSQAKRNALAKQVGEGKRKGQETSAIEAEAASLRDAMQALEARAADTADLIAFGRPWIGTPDLVTRLRTGAAITDAPRETWYGGGATGYTDWPRAE